MSPQTRRTARVEELRASEHEELPARLVQSTDAVVEAVREKIERVVASVDSDDKAGAVQSRLERIDIEAEWTEWTPDEVNVALTHVLQEWERRRERTP